MAECLTWFPVSIYQQENLLNKEQNFNLKTHSLDMRSKVKSGGTEWLGNTYTTLNTFDLKTDIKFKFLIDLMHSHVKQYAKLHGAEDSNYEATGAWLNINDKGTFQEFHTHNDAIFSCVYWVAAPEGSGDLIFEDPKEPDMLRIKNVTNLNPLSFTRINYKAQEGALLIFRSYLRHMVEPCNNSQPRISVAVNFK